MTYYDVETFTGAEGDVLRRYVTNLDKPVFALVNLPEVVKGALFARYSRSNKSLRRLLLDEFIDDLDITGDINIDATTGLERAEQLYERVFVEYGDDSIAQLGGVHLACEQASNLLTKVLERGRLMSYLEQSTRYLAYNNRRHGRYRYYRPPEILSSPTGARYVGAMDKIFDAYGEMVPAMQSHLANQLRTEGSVDDLATKRATRAKAFDTSRGLLPAASVSNVGIFGSGQGYEALLLRMHASPLPEARQYSKLMLTELRKVIPSFLRRVDQPDRGQAWSNYLRTNRKSMEDFAEELFGNAEPQGGPEVQLLNWDPDGENKLLAAMLFSYTNLSETRLSAEVVAMGQEDRQELVRRYVGERGNRRHRPGRALECIDYRFEVLGDYGSFRDLQRHRLLSIDWQKLTPHHGYVVPDDITAAGEGERYEQVMDLSAELYDDIGQDLGPELAAYAVAFAYRIRYIMQFNAREAMHMIELRTQPQGHTDYRRICQAMQRQIGEQAGHGAVAALMSYALTGDAAQGRLEAEQATAVRRPG